MSGTILVVDDEAHLRSLLEGYLTQRGYHVVCARDGREALLVARHERPELIVLDVMMPEMDGYEFMRRFRKEAQTPIILLTARVEEGDRVVGLEAGADDYVVKPFSPRELTARIAAVLRRRGESAPPATVLHGKGIMLDRDARMVSVDGRRIDLTPMEFDLLIALMSSPGRVFTRLDLLEMTQGTRFEGAERTIDVHIKNLRAKIEAEPRNPVWIQTVYSVGYRFAKE